MTIKELIYKDRRVMLFLNGTYVYFVNSLFLFSNVLPPFLRTPLLSVFIGKVGRNIFLDYGIFIKFPRLLSIGDFTAINRGTEFYSDFQSRSKIVIGRNCRIAPNVRFHAAGHSMKDFSYPHTGADITVEDNVWIGATAIVLQGVTIGEGSVVAAGSVVNRDVPPNTLVGGVPAEIIRACR